MGILLSRQNLDLFGEDELIDLDHQHMIIPIQDTQSGEQWKDSSSFWECYLSIDISCLIGIMILVLRS